MQTVVRAIDQISIAAAKVAGWLLVFLVLLTVEQVAARYLFNNSSIAAQELEWHLYALVFLLALANTLRTDQHVRVDILYANFSMRTQAMVNLFGTIFFLWPCALLCVYFGYQFSLQSLNYVNPHPPDYLSASILAADSLLYQWLSPLERGIRATVLAGEISANPGGLEGRWLIKGAIPIAFSLVLIQSIAIFIRNVSIALSKDHAR